MPVRYYTVTEVKLPGLYQPCLQSILRRQEKRRSWAEEEFRTVYQLQSAAPPGVQALYQLYSKAEGLENGWLLCYTDRIVELDPDWALTEEQLRLAAERLALA